MIQLRTRKAIRNKDSLIVTLPSVWRDNAQVKPGDKILCYVDDNGKLVMQKGAA